MKSADIETIVSWAWECPECAYLNEPMFNPCKEDFVVCMSCGEKSKPKEKE